MVCNTEIYTSIWTVSSTAVFVPLSKSFLSYIHQTSHRCVLPKILLLDVKIKCCKTCWIQTSKHYIYKKSVQFGCIYYAIMDIYIIVIYYSPLSGFECHNFYHFMILLLDFQQLIFAHIHVIVRNVDFPSNQVIWSMYIFFFVSQ